MGIVADLNVLSRAASEDCASETRMPSSPATSARLEEGRMSLKDKNRIPGEAPLLSSLLPKDALL